VKRRSSVMGGPLAYLDRWSFAAGEEVDVRASGIGSIRLDLLRLGGLDGKGLPTGYRYEVIGDSQWLTLAERPIVRGSWAQVDTGPTVTKNEDWSWSLTFLPTLTDGGTLLEWGDLGRVRLLDGQLFISIGDGEARLAIAANAWWHLALVRDEHGVVVRLEPTGSNAWSRQSSQTRIDTSRRIITGDLIIGRGFNGKIESPTLRVAGEIVAGWDFAENMEGQTVRGHGGRATPMKLVGAPRRGVTNSAWDGTAHDWTKMPEHFAAIHVHDDDLDDCDWPISGTVQLPVDLASGIYAIRLMGDTGTHHVPLFVRPGNDPAVLFLASTFSYLAYGNSLWASPSAAEIEKTHPDEAASMRHCGLSLYARHRDGSGVGQVSLKRPLLNAKPGFLGEAIGGQVLLNDDLRILEWLNRSSEDFGVITDHDLHQNGVDALGGTRVIVTGAHPEYHSRETLDALQEFASRGGRIIYMGGNGFYWRVATLPDAPHVMEVRRAENGIRIWTEPHGEYCHQADGLRGGTWRQLGRAPNALVGVGYSAQGDMSPTRPFVRTEAASDARVAFLFEGVAQGEIGREGPTGAAGGYELDRADAALGTPPHALVIARTAPFDDGLYPVNEERLTHTLVAATDPLRADMVFFEGPKGGAVLSIGSVLFAGRLDEEDGAGRLATNALRRFADPAPFAIPVEQ
ncbi:MAG: N,N-dimethylformamidase beta subunit family domain-containing protein, partial [Sphingomonas sp.]